MVAAVHGAKYDLAHLRTLSFIDRDGASLLGIAKAAEAIGMEATAVQLPFYGTDDTAGLVEMGLPLIVHWEQNHYVVVYRISRQYVWIADPRSYDIQRLPIATFRARWKMGHTSGIALLLAPTSDFLTLANTNDSPTGTHYRGFSSLLHPHRRLIIQLAIGMIAAGVMQLIAPLLTQAVVDIGINQRNPGFVYMMLAGMLLPL
ncbi:MAG: cysteine peptidase family C39 domain-containing protein [Saprospiraceae bacterium]